MAETKKRHSGDGTGNAWIIKRLLCCSAIGIACMMVLFLICSALSLQYDLSGSLFTSLGYFCICGSSLLCGVLSGRIIRRNGLLYGAVSAVPGYLVLLILCFTLGTGAGLGMRISILLMPLFGAVGGILGINRKHKRKYK